jgi:hypothetical protein
VHVVVKNPGFFVCGEVHGPILRRDRAAVDGAEVPIGPLGSFCFASGVELRAGMLCVRGPRLQWSLGANSVELGTRGIAQRVAAISSGSPRRSVADLHVFFWHGGSLRPKPKAQMNRKYSSPPQRVPVTSSHGQHINLRRGGHRERRIAFPVLRSPRRPPPGQQS